MGKTIWIAVASGKPLGKGYTGWRYTFCAWWQAEPQREPFRLPDDYGGASDADHARAKAEERARAVAAVSQVIELHPRWCRAGRRAVVGQAPWVNDGSEQREAEARRRADALDAASRGVIAAFLDSIHAPDELRSDTLFTCERMGAVVLWEIESCEGGRIKVRNPVDRREGVTLDAAELDREGRAWSWKRASYFYRAPPVHPPKAHEAPGRRVVIRLDDALYLPEARAKLGITADATEDDIKRAFRRLAAATHPDRGGSSEAFREATRARDVALAAIGASR